MQLATAELAEIRRESGRNQTAIDTTTPHIARACAGMLFDTLETVVTLMRKATTQTGLRTTVNVIRRLYETGRNATEEMKNNLKIAFDDLLPKWNYRAVPQNATIIR
jgi:hypothetical protein